MTFETQVYCFHCHKRESDHNPLGGCNTGATAGLTHWLPFDGQNACPEPQHLAGPHCHLTMQPVK